METFKHETSSGRILWLGFHNGYFVFDFDEDHVLELLKANERNAVLSKYYGEAELETLRAYFRHLDKIAVSSTKGKEAITLPDLDTAGYRDTPSLAKRRDDSGITYAVLSSLAKPHNSIIRMYANAPLHWQIVVPDAGSNKNAEILADQLNRVVEIVTNGEVDDSGK